jgi:hypothetical protein
MRLLLDESLPYRLKTVFPGHRAHTVAEMGWKSFSNGELTRPEFTREKCFVYSVSVDPSGLSAQPMEGPIREGRPVMRKA